MITSDRGWDIIGDIHGCAKTLKRLLDELGYKLVHGVYRHRGRKAVFVGDIVDRGPRIREALHIVREMVERGAADIVMGNHEYNALGYCTKGRPGSGHSYLREHTPRHERLIRETLEQFANYPREWDEFLEWFYTMPLFLEYDSFRVVHACWDDQLIQRFRREQSGNCIDEDFLHASVVRESFAGQVMDRLLRGTDMRLPNGESITGRDGFVRSFFRTKFWADNPATYDDIVFQPDPLPPHIAEHPLTDEEKSQLLTYPKDLPPVFVGHYWMSGTPTPIQSNIACLDYSAVKYGKLAAYRMDGEAHLRSEKFIWIPVRREEDIS